MAHNDRVVPAGPLWTEAQLRAELESAGLHRDHLIEVPVSRFELDPDRSRARSRRARKVLIGLGVVTALFLAAVVGFPDLRRSFLAGPSTSIILLFVFNVWFGWRYRERIRTDVPAGSQAETFVRALLDATAVTRAVRGRRLIFTTGEDAALVTQEEQWTTAGPQPRLQLRWSMTQRRITALRGGARSWAPQVRVTFADESSTVLVLGRPARETLLRHWPVS